MGANAGNGCKLLSKKCRESLDTSTDAFLRDYSYPNQTIPWICFFISVRLKFSFRHLQSRIHIHSVNLIFLFLTRSWMCLILDIFRRTYLISSLNVNFLSPHIRRFHPGLSKRVYASIFRGIKYLYTTTGSRRKEEGTLERDVRADDCCGWRFTRSARTSQDPCHNVARCVIFGSISNKIIINKFHK